MLFGWLRKKKVPEQNRGVDASVVDSVLKSIPDFWDAYAKLKEEIRERYNWACDSLCYLPDGVNLYDENGTQIVVPFNDIYLLAATGEEDTLGYTFLPMNVLLDEE